MNDIYASRRNILIYLLVVVVVFAILLVSILRKKQSTELKPFSAGIEIKYTRLLMGTVVEITLGGDNEQVIKDAAAAGFDEIARLEKLLSHYQDTSDVSMINKFGWEKPVKVSQETMDVIDASERVSEMTNGAFDITMGVLGRVWHFTKDDKGEFIPPSEDDVKKLLPLVDYRRIIIDRDSSTVKFAKDGMRINLGGIAKGYIVAKAVDAIKKKGVKSGIVHAGGDMFVFQEDGNAPRKIGIQHPRKKDNIIGTIEVLNGAVSTSGDYERFFIKNSIRYHHIINTKTGFPAVGTQAVTIVANDGMIADVISTAVFIMGTEDGMKFIEDLPEVEGLIIDANGNITVSSGLKGRLSLISEIVF